MTQRVKNAIWNPETFSKSYDFSSPIGSTGVFYAAGYYDTPAGHKAATQGAATQTYGGVNHLHAGHAFIVAGAAGVVAVGGELLSADAGLGNGTEVSIFQSAFGG